MTKFENATLYIDDKNCGPVEFLEVGIEVNPLPTSSSFVLDDIKFSGEMTILSSPPFERTMEYKAFKETCVKEAKRAVAEYKRKVGR